MRERRKTRPRGRRGRENGPLNLRTTGLELDEELDGYLRSTLAFQAGHYAPWMKRTTVHFEATQGPRGQLATLCHAKVVLQGLETVVVDAIAPTPHQAIDRLAEDIDAAVRARLDPVVIVPTPEPLERLPKRHLPPVPQAGSLMGKRQGHGKAAMARVLRRPEKVRRDQPTDTSKPGMSASDRRAGGRSTARRNSKVNDARAAAALEDSSRDRPSRKYTRKSANRFRHGTKQQLRQVNAVHSSKERATRAKVHR